ncbi:MAG: hypothetical protein LBD30_07360 [Verrucomicrobiales bacterium]|nr:hypothetical protein [Verrucomicrobiales bacterium]
MRADFDEMSTTAALPETRAQFASYADTLASAERVLIHVDNARPLMVGDITVPRPAKIIYADELDKLSRKVFSSQCSTPPLTLNPKKLNTEN